MTCLKPLLYRFTGLATTPFSLALKQFFRNWLIAWLVIIFLIAKIDQFSLK
jgi:hypothetical protein